MGEMLMVPDSGAWEEDYTLRGMLWGGGTHVVPDLPVNSRVLELGCGNGKSLFAMIQRGWNVIAIDFSSRAVTLSREILGDDSYGQVLIADARSPPFKQGTFDAVFALHVIGHMRETDRHSIANTLHHILRPGGILFFSDFSTHDFRFGKGDETETGTYRRGPGILTHYFAEMEVIDLFSKLTPLSIRIHQWPLRVLGNTLIRSEIVATFSRKECR
jgi:SAM-dependent methyltransferase